MIKFLKPNRFNYIASSVILGTGSALLFCLFFLFFGDLAEFIAQFLLIVVFILCVRDKRSVDIAFIANMACVYILLGEVKYLFYYMISTIIPVYLLTKLALTYKTFKRKKYWYPNQMLLTWLCVYALFLTILMFFYWYPFHDIASTLSSINSSLDSLPSEMYNQRVKLEKYTSLLVPYFPGIKGMWFVFTISSATSYAQKWFKKRKLNIIRSPIILSEIYLPMWIWGAFIICSVMLIISDFINTKTQYFVGNLLLPLLALFVIQGLSVVYTFAKRQKKRYILFVFLSIFMLGWPIIGVIILGLIEPWVQLRNRISKDK